MHSSIYLNLCNLILFSILQDINLQNPMINMNNKCIIGIASNLDREVCKLISVSF